jgi:hypothetical protein
MTWTAASAKMEVANPRRFLARLPGKYTIRAVLTKRPAISPREKDVLMMHGHFGAVVAVYHHAASRAAIVIGDWAGLDRFFSLCRHTN